MWIQGRPCAISVTGNSIKCRTVAGQTASGKYEKVSTRLGLGSELEVSFD